MSEELVYYKSRRTGVVFSSRKQNSKPFEKAKDMYVRCTKDEYKRVVAAMQAGKPINSGNSDFMAEVETIDADEVKVAARRRKASINE
jgi:hypothetical protein